MKTANKATKRSNATFAQLAEEMGGVRFDLGKVTDAIEMLRRALDVDHHVDPAAYVCALALVRSMLSDVDLRTRATMIVAYRNSRRAA